MRLFYQCKFFVPKYGMVLKKYVSRRKRLPKPGSMLPKYQALKAK